ncbi:helix-turn-helix transcriptional regulator [Xenorhabdus sp. 12]|uniref:Helix-turn-helix transcriptional regulator n=1 Tax=Xenorhabdus santafensis TaxID=2582833 RepID=A0ABU4SAM9_9GAMM|nr:helix-turn-helix transcriptional regulator [Xenorhabdus sp. 12]MDX7987835.1 helix-turn-helix transcriptional regulator [Xenorhabdus sp. 12]
MKNLNLAERLAEAMKLRKMTQGALAEASGVAQPTIWRLTQGQAKGSSKIIDIANALSVNPEWLANGTGSMLVGDEESVTPSLSKHPQISIWNSNGKTDNFVISPSDKPKQTWRAYIMERNSGCAEAPYGSVVIIDTAIVPGTKDLVIATVNQNISVYKFLDGGTSGYLAVDDFRIPLIDLSLPSANLLGVVVFLLIDLRKWAEKSPLVAGHTVT